MALKEKAGNRPTLSKHTKSTDNNSNNSDYYNPLDHLRSYSHRFIGAPLRADIFGIELEYLGDINPICHFRKEFEYLDNYNWVLERDKSVSFELKSPVMTMEEVKQIFTHCKNLFKVWAENTDPNRAGLHVHVSFDDVFAVNKHPSKQTYIFLTRLFQYIENRLFPNDKLRRKTFKRDFTRYAVSTLGFDNAVVQRYIWCNIQNLTACCSKTIEFRLGSASLASELDVYVEKVYILAKFIKLAIKDWRKKKRPEFSLWEKSFKQNQLFEALLPERLFKKFVKFFD